MLGRIGLPHNKYRRETLVAAISVVLFWFLYRDFLNGWWMADDSQHLLSVIRSGIWAHFYVPNEKLGLIPANLTPWLYLDYGIDFWFGGLQPHAAYIHHLLAWLATLVALSVLLVRILGSVFSLIAIALWLLSVPVGSVAQLLCTRHYLEGLLFSILSILSYRSYCASPTSRTLLLATLFYGVAITAKEIFVPLGILLIAHRALKVEYRPARTSASWTECIEIAQSFVVATKRMWPIIIVMASYVIWRAHMLGWHRLVAGYEDPGLRTQPAMLLNLPATWAKTMQWTPWMEPLWASLIGLALALWLIASPRAARLPTVAFTGIATLTILLPLYPVLARIEVNPHYLFLPGLIWSVCAAWALRFCAQYSTASAPVDIAPRFAASVRNVELVATSASLVALLLVGQFDARSRFWLWGDREYIAQYRIEGEHELFGTDLSLIVDAIGPTWHHAGLRDIRHRLLGRSEGPNACDTDSCRKMRIEQVARGKHCVRFAASPARLDVIECREP